jgi:hypothetical protein
LSVGRVIAATLGIALRDGPDMDKKAVLDRLERHFQPCREQAPPGGLPHSDGEEVLGGEGARSAAIPGVIAGMFRVLLPPLRSKAAQL